MPLSYSQVSTYRRCPRQYEYQSVKKLPRKISEGESFGSSIHNTLRKFGLLELACQQPSAKNQLTLFTEDHHQNPVAELSLTTLLSLWRESFIADGYETRAEMDARFKEGEEALKNYFEWWQREPREIVAIEKGFSFEIKGSPAVQFSGRFDRVERTEKGLRIIDYKSSAPREVQTLQSDLQLSMYAIAATDLWQEPIASLMLLHVRADGITELVTERSKEELQDALTSIRILNERMLAKDFAATPSIAVCKHCPYRDICPVRA